MTYLILTVLYKNKMKKLIGLLIITILSSGCAKNNEMIIDKEIKKTVISSEGIIDISNIDKEPNY